MRTGLKRKREEWGHTQKTLAEAIGLSEVGYSLIEQGKRDGTLATWKKIKSALRIPDKEMWPTMAEE